ncbi:probable L-cysteine desulfhydrase, chloroplastic [Ziziphus jujuba]|uniref:Aminotransferase class V domain-containing protein n=2 Tax=Ziziphus jujuba TaxID=326968 RepID=A0A978VVP4_ZIZJJ|nr:probable L-cysteine desulfhydrase, chloroplastic [Ziziphus jujuba]KAH7542889.1 hypothetical protein FEM48_Zijuj02G0123100 [Ziziphus jujuba var. spinosa]
MPRQRTMSYHRRFSLFLLLQHQKPQFLKFKPLFQLLLAYYHDHYPNHNAVPKSHIHIKPSLSSFITDSKIQSEFAHHDPGVARINNGSFGCCPAPVITALQQWQLKYLRQPDHFYYNELRQGILKTRTIIKDLVNAYDVDEISVLDNTTTAVAIVLQKTAWAFSEGTYNKGDAIIVLQYGYGAVRNSIKAYVSRAGGDVIEVHFKFPVSSNNEIISAFRKALKEGKTNGKNIRLAVIDHVTSMPSFVIPVKELVKTCREEGVDQVFVDGAHGIGCIDVDMKEIGADFYTSNLHKWFFSPPAVAFLYCRKLSKCSDLHHPIVSHDYGNGLAIESAWVGTRDYSPLLVVPSVLEFISRFEKGIHGIMERNHEAVVEMGKMLAKAWGTNLGSPPEMCAAMIMVGLPSCLGISSENDCVKLRTHLRESFGVEVHIYYRTPEDGEVEPITGYARISHQVYNKIDDYLKFRNAINQLVGNGFTCTSLLD